MFQSRGWVAEQYRQWADHLLRDQVAFVPPSVWEGLAVARFAFLHPHTSMDLVREILDGTGRTRHGSAAEALVLR